MTIELKELDLEAVSDIKVVFQKGFSRIDKRKSILLVSYSGHYPSGAQGNKDAVYMYAKAEYGIMLVEPNSVILDFRELDYSWGDMLEIVFTVNDCGKIFMPAFALIVGDRCKDAIGTLLQDDPFSKIPATDEEWVFDDFEDAWTYVEEKLAGR